MEILQMCVLIINSNFVLEISFQLTNQIENWVTVTRTWKISSVRIPHSPSKLLYPISLLSGRWESQWDKSTNQQRNPNTKKIQIQIKISPLTLSLCYLDAETNQQINKEIQIQKRYPNTNKEIQIQRLSQWGFPTHQQCHIREAKKNANANALENELLTNTTYKSLRDATNLDRTEINWGEKIWRIIVSGNFTSANMTTIQQFSNAHRSEIKCVYLCKTTK